MTRKKYFCKVRLFMRFIKSLLRKTDIQTSHHSNHTIPPIENLINPLSNHHTKITRKSHNLRNIYIYIAPSSLSCLEFFYKGERHKRDKNPKPYSKYLGFLNPNTKVFRAIFLPFFFPSSGDTKARSL